MTMGKPDPALYAGDLFGEFYQAEQDRSPKRFALRELVRGKR